MRARLKTLGDARAGNSRAIVAALAAHPAFLAAQTVALFAPIPTEPDVELLWENSARQFCYPRVTGPSRQIDQCHSRLHRQGNPGVGWPHLGRQ